MNKKRRMFLRMIAASLLRRRSRMIIALLAIAVGATILSGLGLIYFDVPRQMSSQFRSYGANIIFTAENETGIADEAIQAGIEAFPDAELEGYTPYRYENTNIHNMPVTMAGTDFDSALKTSPYWYIDGEMPTGNGEALVGAKVAEALGIKTGDSITALNSFAVTPDMDMSAVPDYEIYTDPETNEAYCDHELELTVSAVLQTGGPEEEYVYVTLEDMEYLFLTNRGADIVEVSVASTQDELEEYIREINENVEGISAKLVKRVTASESTVLTKLQSLVFIVTAVVLILTMICVATTMTAVIAERRKEIALRKSLGATNTSLVGQFMSEGLLLGAIGGILGSVLGYVFAQYVSLNVFSSVLAFRPLLIPITIIASVIVTVLACMVPVKGAVEVDPAIVLKGE